MVLGGGTFVGGVIAILYGVGRHPFWQILSAVAMFAAASMAAGGLLGLLFGVPRSLGTVQAHDQSTGAVSTALAGIGANTNLEQISDWLTKIIVGVSLTQLGSIKRGGSHLFNAMAPSLGGGANGAAFAGGLVIYFSVLGFFVGWLYARLRLGAAMSAADAMLEIGRRADKSPDRAMARAIKDAATARLITPLADADSQPTSANVSTLAADYAQLRASLAPGAARTARLEGIVRSARELGRAHTLTAQDVRGLFQTGDEGSRIVALGLMEGDLSCADLPSVLDAIRNSMSAFEQYQALVLANQLVSTLNAQDRESLRSTLNDQAVRAKFGNDSSRVELAARIVARLAGIGGGQSG